jgi:hypothetical protein
MRSIDNWGQYWGHLHFLDMEMPPVPITDIVLKTAKATGKTFRLSDERGLYLEVSPNGGKWWRWKYRFNGKEKRLSFGVYPDVKLKDARERRDAARNLLTNGIDPSENRKAQKSAAPTAWQIVLRW